MHARTHARPPARTHARPHTPTITHHVGERDVDEHPGGDGEDPDADVVVGRHGDADVEADDGRQSRQEVKQRGLPPGHAGLQQDGEVACNA